MLLVLRGKKDVGAPPPVIYKVTTLPALTALDPSTLTDGQTVWVSGAQGGLFRWDAGSSLPTDGGIVFVPDAKTAQAPVHTLEYGHYGNPNGFRQLPHTDIVWGSVAVEYDDQTKTLGSEWFHGHSVAPRHSPGSPVRDAPILDHGSGQILGDPAFRIRNLIWSNTNTDPDPNNRISNLTYRYATGSGRWVREVEDYVTPAMFGGIPDDPSFDNAFAICWALNWLNSQERIKTLRYDGTYWVRGFWGEIYSGIRQVGLGREKPCVMYHDDVADFLKAVYLGWADWQAAGLFDPYRLMWVHNTLQMHFDNATGFSFDDFCVDGNIQNNLYFLTDQTGAWDATPITGQVSQTLRESPTYAGFFLIDQSGRYVAPGTRFFASNSCWMNMGGSCLVYASGGEGVLEGVRAGNSLSGRVFYGGAGKVSGIELFGYTRTSFASPYSGLMTNVSLVSDQANPWPENALDPAGIAHRGDPVWHSTGNPVTDERYGQGILSISGFGIDCSNVRAMFKFQGERFSLSNGRVKGPTGSATFVLRDSGLNNQAHSLSGPHVSDVEIENRCTTSVQVLRDSLGLMAHGVLSDIHIKETFDASGNPISRTTLPAVPDPFAQIVMAPNPGGVDSVEEQIIEFRNIVDETYRGYLLVVTSGGDDPNAVPTIVRFIGCRFNTMVNKWFKSAPTDGTQNASKLRIELIDCVMDTHDPSLPFVGDQTNYAQSMAAVGLIRDCYTRSGQPIGMTI